MKKTAEACFDSMLKDAGDDMIWKLFGKESTAKDLQGQAAKIQDTLVDAVENAEVAEVKRAVF